MTIVNPIRIETVALPGIIEIPPQKMSKYHQMKLPEEKLPTVRRVTESDLEELIPTSVQLLKKSHPNISLNAVIGYVRGNLMSNRARIVRTDNAWGAAEVTRDFYEEQLSAEIKFVCKVKNSATDTIAIYEDLKRWAKSTGAKKLYYGTTTADSNIETFAKRIGFSKKVVGYMLEL